MKLKNDYAAYKIAKGYDLFAVQLQDGGWSIADGRGTNYEAVETAGWHLPIKFATFTQAMEVITCGPDAMFDIAPEGAWALHAIEHGGVLESTYLM